MSSQFEIRKYERISMKVKYSNNFGGSRDQGLLIDSLNRNYYCNITKKLGEHNYDK